MGRHHQGGGDPRSIRHAMHGSAVACQGIDHGRPDAHMRARGWGRIVNISSGAARGAGVFGVHYNASKAGMEGLTRGYAARLLSYGITVNAVAPSLIDTEMIASQRETIAATLPLKRLGTSEEVAVAVVMVVTNAYMTGQTVHVNGGRQFN